MFRLACAFAVAAAAAACSSSDFQVTPPEDARVTLDLAVPSFPPDDMTCFNTECGGCSKWAKWDGTPAHVGDPCLWNGVLQCTGMALTCTSTACLPCSPGGTPTPVSGSVCGADGHTIVELLTQNGTCSAYDFNSAINVCNHSSVDKCEQRCTNNGSSYSCAAYCLSDDGGVAHEYSASATCVTLQ
jgi:hypothetical protein